MPLLRLAKGVYRTQRETVDKMVYSEVTSLSRQESSQQDG